MVVGIMLLAQVVLAKVVCFVLRTLFTWLECFPLSLQIARVVKDPTVSPEQFCEYFNACLPSETRSYDPSETRAKGELRRETKTSEDRRGLTDGKSGTSREDAIKVVQLTDIHVERNYSVVRTLPIFLSLQIAMERHLQ